MNEHIAAAYERNDHLHTLRGNVLRCLAVAAHPPDELLDELQPYVEQVAAAAAWFVDASAAEMLDALAVVDYDGLPEAVKIVVEDLLDSWDDGTIHHLVTVLR